jgi:signal peptidase II
LKTPLLCILGLFLLALDIATKWATVSFLSQGQEIPLISAFGIDVSLTYTTNLGAAWGLFNSMPYALLTVRILFIALLVWYLFVGPPLPLLRIPLTLLFFGAIGNVLDFFVYGHVIDMVHCCFFGYDYPVFNVADMTITVSVGVILFLLIRNRKHLT